LSYFVYDSEGNKLERESELSIKTNSHRDDDDDNNIHHRFPCKTSSGGEAIGEAVVEDQHKLSARSSERIAAVPVYEDEHVFFY